MLVVVWRTLKAGWLQDFQHLAANQKIRLNNVEVQTKARRDGEIMLALTWFPQMSRPSFHCSWNGTPFFMYQWIRNMFDCQNIYFDKWSPRSILEIQNFEIFSECVKFVTSNYDHVWSIFSLKILCNFSIAIDENDFESDCCNFCRHFFANWCAWKLFMYICWEDGLLTN